MKRLCFISRKHADTPSIERVFRTLTREFEKNGIEVLHVRLPFGNSFPGIIGNLLFFRPPKADILHVTGHVHYLGLRLPTQKTVVTVHDLGILRSRSGLRHWLIKKLFFDWPFQKVRFLTAISEATKVDMVKLAGCEPEKIKIINDPLDPLMNGETRSFNEANPTILQIGTAPHKNLERLLEAINGLRCRLMVVGNMSQTILRQLNASSIEFELCSAETDVDMKATYDRCDLVVFCSTFEGFGLPIIEAQANGIPLVTSDLPPMNDIAGRGAITVDPFDPSKIRAAIEEITFNPNIRNKIVAEGKINVKRFDPERIASQYLDLYYRIESNTY